MNTEKSNTPIFSLFVFFWINIFKAGLVWSNKRVIKGFNYFLITAPPTAQGQSIMHLCDYVFGTSLVAAHDHKNLKLYRPSQNKRNRLGTVSSH